MVHALNVKNTACMNIIDLYIVSLGGPVYGKTSVFSASLWIFLQIFIILLIEILLSERVDESNCLISMRIVDKTKWIVSKHIVIFITVFGVYIIGSAVIIIIGSFFWPLELVWSEYAKEIPYINTKIAGVKASILLLVMVISSSTMIIAVKIAIDKLFKNSKYSFVIISIDLLFSWLFGNQEMLPFSKYFFTIQSISMRHDFLNVNYGGYQMRWSLLYNLLVFVSAIAINAIISNKNRTY
jgi:hypothetical protein